MVFFVAQLFFTNGIFLFFGAICFWVIFTNVQQPLKPSIFSIIFIYHLIQIMAGVWLSNYLGKDINFRSDHSDTAIIYSYVGLTIMFLPIIYYQRKIPLISISLLRQHAERLSIKKSFQVYLIAFFITNTLAGVAFVVPGLSQVIFSFINIKWFFFLLLGFQVLLKKTMYKEFFLFVAIEFLLGFFSYFSDFKTVFFFIGFLSLVFLQKVYLKQLVIFGIIVYAGFSLGVLWTSIKGEYRTFLNQGTKSQTVNVEKGQAFEKLVELSGNREQSDNDAAAADLFDRLQYTYHLAKTMDRIPAVIPHEDGGNIASIISFVTTPRFFNPNKPKIESSKKATKYTGIAYAGSAAGVSFSLGYFADCYIDFGYYGMMIPLLILGFIFGSTYFYFVRKSSNNFVFNFSVVGAMYMEFHALEADGIYLMGRLFATLLTFFMLKHFFFPWLYNFLKEPAPEPVHTKVPIFVTTAV